MSTFIYFLLLLIIVVLIWAFIYRLPILSTNPMGLSSLSTVLLKKVDIVDDRHLEGVPIVRNPKFYHINTWFKGGNSLLIEFKCVIKNRDAVNHFLEKNRKTIWLYSENNHDHVVLFSYDGQQRIEIELC